MIWPALPDSVTARTMPGTGLGVEAHHAGQVGVALDDRRGVGRHLLDVGPGFLVGHHLDARALLGERVAQALARLDEVAGGEERDRADLAALETRLGMVAALVLAVLVAKVVPVGAEISEALGHRQVAVGNDRRHLLVDALVDLGGKGVVPAADHDHARRVLGALGVDRGDESGEIDRRRAGDPHVDVQRLARRLQARIDPLDEQRQVRGVADPDVLLVAPARIAERHVKPGGPFGAGRRVGRQERCQHECAHRYVFHGILPFLPVRPSANLRRGRAPARTGRARR